ncbi:MAG: hypothetical protein ACK4N5_11810, partial [Myxococcales bacterium]
MRRSSMAAVAAAALLGAGCGEPLPVDPPAGDPDGGTVADGGPTGPSSRWTNPTPHEGLAKAFAELEKASPDVAALKDTWTGGLKAFVEETDALLKRTDAARIGALLEEPDAIELVDVSSLLQLSASLRMREEIKKVTDAYPDPVKPQAELLAGWEAGLRVFLALKPFFDVADEAAKDTAFAEARAAFDAGNVGIQENDFVAVGGNRQIVEKTWFRAMHHLTVARAKQAEALANPTEAHFVAQRRSLGALWLLQDRMAGRNSKGYVLATRMLSRPLNEVDAEAIEKELFINWSKRTYSYVAHAVNDPKLLGTAGATIQAIEGRTYYKLVAADLKKHLPSADTAATLQVWEKWIEAIRSADAAAAAEASAVLKAQVCDYQKALGIPACTNSEDVKAAAVNLGKNLSGGSTVESALKKVADFVREADANDAEKTAEAYAGELKTWVQSVDAATGKSFDAKIAGLIGQDATQADLAAAKWALYAAIVEIFKKDSKAKVTDKVGGVTASVEEQLKEWDVNHLYFVHGWQPLAKLVDAAKPAEATEAASVAGFERVNLGVQDQDAREAGAGRQQVEKTAFRIFYELVALYAKQAKDHNDVIARQQALGALDVLGDRVSGKVEAAEYTALRDMLTGSPSGIDVEQVKKTMLRAFA